MLGLDDADDAPALRRRVARALGRPDEDVPPFVLLKRSIDARRGRVVFRLLLGLDRVPGPLGEPLPREVGGDPVLVVGDGPAGLFCAYELARAGVASIVCERGKPVQPRRHDLAALVKEGRVDPESNYCFGEGGAGTYSDGKLYTRAHKRGDVRDVLETLALHGAPEAILVEARPHVGSNKLPRVVTALRSRLEGSGVRFRFGAKVEGLETAGHGGARRVTGVRLEHGEVIEAREVVLATGHSARDVLEMLAALDVPLEPKGFALGVRIEHPQALVNRARYGRAAEHPRLPNAAYALAETVAGRGVFSFCMCPGGWIVPATTEPDAVVVNGMSLSRRDSPFANSGLVVALEPEDWQRAGFAGPLGGIELQRRIERAAKAAGGGGQRAPATRAADFVARRASSTAPASSYLPGLEPGDVGEVLDGAGIPIADRLRAAIERFAGQLRGYASSEAVLVAAESRTSSPVRVPRDPETLVCRGLDGVYPAGEGAGWAGGIVSAAMDGMRVARAIVRARAAAGGRHA